MAEKLPPVVNLGSHFSLNSSLFKIPLLIGATLLSLSFLTSCGGSGEENTANANSGTRTNTATPGTANTDPTGKPSKDGPFGELGADGVLVKFKDNGTGKAARSLLKAAGVVEVQNFQLVDGLKLTQLSPGETVEGAVSTLKSSPNVAYAEPNYRVTAMATPNDTRFNQQWALNNTGQIGGANGSDIKASQAWDVQTGNNVIIAVIDTGVDYNHPDLRDNIWTNAAEIANNGIDDDGNGYIDDVRGWDFSSNDNNPMDDNRHGTHVAGIIAAKGNNGTGVSGVNWSARIMPLKFLSFDGGGSTAGAIRALEYAVSMGAKVSNNSWGGGQRSQALADAITAANRGGHLFVTAAGNAGTNNDTRPSYPANFPIANIISVTATNGSDRLATFSNYGSTTVHVAAPGTSILSTIPSNSYATLSGTSMASPFVAGLAGLVLAANPSLSVTQVKDAILQNVDKITALNGRLISAGRINAFKAVSSVATSPIPLALTPTSGTIPVNGTLQFTVNGGAGPYTWSSSNPAVGAINNNTGLLTGRSAGTTTVTATDTRGATVTSQNITITALGVTPNGGRVAVGQTLQLTASGGTAPYQWTSGNNAVATISNNGLLTAVAPGTTTITVQDANGLTAQSGTVDVFRDTAAAITIAPASLVLARSGQGQLNVTGGSSPYSWHSANPAIATVSNTGVVQALAAGKTVVHVTDASGATATTNIEIRDVQVQTQSGSTSIAVGGTMQFSATGGTAPYQWSVSSPAIARINTNGVLTGLSPGQVSVTATDTTGITATSPALTIAAVSSALQVRPQSVQIPARWWVRFSATGGQPPYSWSLSDTAAGDIDGTTGWFRGSSSVGATAEVTVTDAQGNVSKVGPINIIQGL